MMGPATEACVLDAYYEKVDDAKRQMAYRLLDDGLSVWRLALKDVEPHISSKQFDTLRREFDNYLQPQGHGGTSSSDIGSESDEDIESTDDDGNDSSHDSLDDDYSAEIKAHYQAEHMKLMRRRTVEPRFNPRMGPNRSLPSILGQAEVPRTPRPSPGNQNDRPRTFYSNEGSKVESSAEPRAKDPITRSEPRTLREPALSPFSDESKLGVREGRWPRPGGLLATQEDDDWFANLRAITHGFVYGEKKEFWPSQPVKVAILDSGYALEGEMRRAMAPYVSRIKDKKTFTEEFSDLRSPQRNLKALNDPTGHGTTVAWRLMQTCPSAQVYIAKVTVGEDATPNNRAVARAIKHAAESTGSGGWGVDIINMSFGWAESELPSTTETGGVSGAIEFAEKAGVLLFAAASNHGLTKINDVLYPARDPRVISVDAEDGLGNPARFALNSNRGEGGTRYCAPGLSVTAPWSMMPMDGSSFACPLAAGVAALVLEFARFKNVSLSNSPSVKRALSCARGMRRIFETMSQQALNHPGFKMLYPWNFLGHDHREKVALDIIDQLEKEFGKGKVGMEVTYTMRWEKAQK